jgi:hypothetical protein
VGRWSLVVTMDGTARLVAALVANLVARTAPLLLVLSSFILGFLFAPCSVNSGGALSHAMLAVRASRHEVPRRGAPGGPLRRTGKGRDVPLQDPLIADGADSAVRAEFSRDVHPGMNGPVRGGR